MNHALSPTSPQANVTVMASAGTGKTWLLVTRLVRLLLEGAKPDAILAITFTRKAATEMQTRLMERLLELACVDDESLDRLLGGMSIEANAESRSQARRLYEKLLHSEHPLRTTTFHAFCQDILRRFPLDADVPPGFELVERTGELLQAAQEIFIAETTREADGESAHALDTLLEYCGSLTNLHAALNSFIQHRSDWWAYTEASQTPVAFADASLREALATDPNADPVADFFTQEHEQALAEFARLLEKHPTATNTGFITLLDQAADRDKGYQERFAYIGSVFFTQAGTPRSRKASKAQAGKMGDAGEARFLALHSLMCAVISSVQEALNRQMCYRGGSAWYRCGSRLLEHYQRLKAEQRVLDFADLEWKAYSLLNQAENAHWIQYKLDQRIDHLLVDEFQDTNPTQWRLLLPLLQEIASGSAERLRSVFLVGDTKQSIYRFRRAEPRLFDSAQHWLQERMGARPHDLHTSWRSAPAIMECVNAVFQQEAMQGVIADFPAHQTHRTGLWGKVTLLPLIQADCEAIEHEALAELRNPLQRPRLLQLDDRYLREGREIARQIDALLAGPTLLGEGDGVRPTGFADIMILVRSRTHVGDYERALREAGIPYIGAERGTLLESQEVQDMVALLNHLITPYDNLGLATILRSPLFDCHSEELVRLASADAQSDWYNRLLQLALELPEGHNLRYAAEKLAGWHGLAGHVPIHDLLDHIFRDGNVLARYRAAYPAALRDRAEANLNRFIELALEVDHGRYPSLSHFLARLQEMAINSQEAPDEAPSNNQDARVRIMTIHAAKGLEAPIVFLADTAASPRKDSPFRTLVQWPVERERPEHFLLVGRKEQRDPLTQALLDEEASAEQRESANLLYVALTRAKQMLFISGCATSRSNDQSWYQLIRNGLAPDTETNEQPVVWQSGSMPPLAAPPVVSEAAVEGQTDPRFGQPIALPERTAIEIAPSRLVSGSHGGSGMGDDDALQRGIAIHRLLQLLSETAEAQHPAIKATLAAELGLAPDYPDLDEWWQEAIGLYHDKRLTQLFQPQGATCYNEVPISYGMKQEGRQVTVYGFIDRLLVCNDHLWLVDYKTHRHANPSNIQALAQPYEVQMRYYAEGLKKLWPGKPVRATLLFTHCRGTVDLDID